MNGSGPYRPLLDAYPGLREKLPFVELAELPTAVDRMTALADKIGVPELLVKRDDQSASDYGGNKVRKLEFLLAHALDCGATAVLTFGGAGSNHALATSIYAHRLGLTCHAILTPEPPTPAVARKLRYHLNLGTHLYSASTGAEIREARRQVLYGQSGTESPIYEIPFGGSSWLGVCGFVNAGLELSEQIAAGELAAPDEIYVAAGTEGTVAGLALGLGSAGVDAMIHAVKVVPDATGRPDMLNELTTDTAARLHQMDPSFRPPEKPLDRVTMRWEFLGDGYAQPTAGAISATELVARLEGIELETTYSAKAMVGLIEDAAAGRLAGKRTLFWNTYNSRPYPRLDENVSVDSLPSGLRHYLND